MPSYKKSLQGPLSVVGRQPTLRITDGLSSALSTPILQANTHSKAFDEIYGAAAHCGWWRRLSTPKKKQQVGFFGTRAFRRVSAFQPRLSAFQLRAAQRRQSRVGAVSVGTRPGGRLAKLAFYFSKFARLDSSFQALVQLA